MYIVGEETSHEFGIYYHGGSFSPVSHSQECSLNTADQIYIGAFHGVAKRLVIYT